MNKITDEKKKCVEFNIRKTCAESNEKFLHSIVTLDETSCFQYDPETKPVLKEVIWKKCRYRSQKGGYIDFQGITYKQLISSSQKITEEYYLNVTKHLLDVYCAFCQNITIMRSGDRYKKMAIAFHQLQIFC